MAWSHDDWRVYIDSDGMDLFAHLIVRTVGLPAILSGDHMATALLLLTESKNNPTRYFKTGMLCRTVFPIADHLTLVSTANAYGPFLKIWNKMESLEVSLFSSLFLPNPKRIWGNFRIADAYPMLIV